MAAAKMSATELDRRVETVRSFNRAYTKQIGLLQAGYLHSRFSLAEVRVMYELSHRDGPTASEVGKELGLDPGYLSRILHSFEKRGLIQRRPSRSDGRQTHLSLTKQGEKAFAPLQAEAHAEVAAMLAKLSPTQQRQLIDAMHAIEGLLGARPEAPPSYVLRPHRPGDMGWIIHRHGALYAEEYGWDETFEALVAEIAAKFIKDFDPKRERCWIAEIDGAIVGSIFLVQQSRDVAKLRLLLVEPSARGLGIGGRLVSECVRFAHQCGYKTVTLWTQSILHAAQQIYKKAGFQLVKTEPHHSFGHALVSQVWELALPAAKKS